MGVISRSQIPDEPSTIIQMEKIDTALSRSMHLFIWVLLLLLGVSKTFAQSRTIDSLEQLYKMSDHEEDKIIYLSKIAFYTAGSDLDDALSKAEQALARSQEIDFQEGIASSYNTIGWVYFKSGQTEKGIRHIQTAINIYQKLNSDEDVLSGYLNLSSIFIRDRNYAEALQYLLQALPLLDSYPDYPQITGIYGNLGIVYRELKDYDKSIEYFNRAIAVNLKNNHHVLAADIKVSLGILYKQIGNITLALQEYREAYNLYHGENHQYGMGIVRENQGELYLDMGEYDKALQSFEEAKSTYEAIGDKSDLAYISMDLAKAQSHLNNFQAAIENLELSLNLAQESGVINYEMDIYEQLSETYEMQNNYGAALESYKRFQNLKDSIKSEAQVNQLNRIRTEFETAQKDKEISLLNTEKLLQKEKNRRRFWLAVSAILAAVSIAIALFIRSKYLEKKNLLSIQEKQLAQKQQEEAEQKLLRSQMNPHFIFNALNTIDSFVLQNRKLEASKLIQRFSKLSRKVLESTAQSDISIEEDLDIIQVYLQIEQTRYSGAFDFTIDIDEEIKNCRVAPMIIQPFVENAILHGIKNRKSDGGLISISVQQDSDKIHYLIQDNGVGRKKAEEIKKMRHKSHTSKAMEITAARLAVMNKGEAVDKYIRYTDLEGEFTGTKVEIWIPKVTPT